MAYTRVNWQDYPNTSTPITALNLNVMDAGISALDTAVTAIQGNYATQTYVNNAIAAAIVDAIEGEY